MSTDGFRTIDEIPYDFMRKRLTIVVSATGEDTHRMICKGAYANALAICDTLHADGGRQPMTGADRQRFGTWCEAQGAQGLRLLALAERDYPPRRDYTREDETGMCLVGFVAFLDPPRSRVRDTLATLGRRGVSVKMVTGDNRHVAASIARGIRWATREMASMMRPRFMRPTSAFRWMTRSMSGARAPTSCFCDRIWTCCARASNMADAPS